MVVASCRNKYYGTNFISAVPTSLLIAPGLRTIQFLLILGLYNLFKKCANDNLDVTAINGFRDFYLMTKRSPDWSKILKSYKTCIIDIILFPFKLVFNKKNVNNKWNDWQRAYKLIAISIIFCIFKLFCSKCTHRVTKAKSFFFLDPEWFKGIFFCFLATNNSVKVGEV
jgi:hypothetical protein